MTTSTVVKPTTTLEEDPRLSGEQLEHRRAASIDTLKQLQSLLSESTTPGTDALSDAIIRAEQVLVSESQRPGLDAETKKVLEDIARLAGSVQQMTKHKDLGDRLQRITNYTRKALAEVQMKDVSPVSREATQQAINVIEVWRPLFQLLLYSREFRELIIDSERIFRRIFLLHQEDVSQITEKVEEHFAKGVSPKGIGKVISEETGYPDIDIRKDISDEEWEQIIDDTVRVLAKIHSHPTFKDGVVRMFNLLDIAREDLRRVGTRVEPAQPHAKMAKKETEELIATFTGKEAFDQFTRSLKRLIRHVDQNERIRKYLAKVREFILSDYMSHEEYKELSKKLAIRGRKLVDEYRYSDEVNDFLDSANILLDNFYNDEFVDVLRYHAAIVTADLSYLDSDGSIKLDTDMLAKLQSAIVPVLAESLKYIPVPKIEGVDNKREFWVDNIVVCGYDIIPDNIRFKIESDSEIGIRDIGMQYSNTRLRISLRNIRTELKNLDFYYKRKTFPQMSEQGRVTVRIGGEGAHVTLIFLIEQLPEDKAPRFTQGKAYFHIGKMDIIFDRKSLKHDFLVPTLTNMFKRQIKSEIESEVEKYLEQILTAFGERLSEALLQVNRPFTPGLAIARARQAIKSSAVSHVYEKRQEKLE